jgi:hypothetical protein
MDASVSVKTAETAELDDSRSRRLTVGKRLLTRRNAEVLGPMRVGARGRP